MMQASFFLSLLHTNILKSSQYVRMIVELSFVLDCCIYKIAEAYDKKYLLFIKAFSFHGKTSFSWLLNFFPKEGQSESWQQYDIVRTIFVDSCCH